jgi:hypothetical protein
VRPSSSTPLWIRYYAIILGIIFLAWIPIEDIHEGFVLVLAGAFTALLAVLYLNRHRKAHRGTWLRQAAIGAIAGLCVTPISLMLMVFKIGVHGHEVPDFTPQQMARVIELTPVWASTGLLVGLGSNLWRAGRDR